MLIGILGRKRVGKDTTADYLCSNYNFEKITLAQPLKDVCKIAYNFSDEQLYGSLKEVIDDRFGVSPRIIYQYLGTDIFRKDINKIIPNIKNNFWINLVAENYLKKIESNANSRIIISDVRFQNEIDRIHELGGIVIKINRAIAENALTTNISNNTCSKYNFDKLKFDQSLKHVCNILFNFTNDQLYGSLQDTIDPRFEVSPDTIYQYLETDVFKNEINIITTCMHESEKDIDFLEADYTIINNNNKEELYKNIDYIMEKILCSNASIFKHTNII